MAGEFPFLVDSLRSLVIRKKNGGSISIYPWNGAPVVNPLISFSLSESIFNPSITGTLIVKDIGDWSNELNLKSFDEIDIILQGVEKEGGLGSQNEQENSQEKLSLTFEITNIKNTVNQANSVFQNGLENVKTLTIEFVNKSVLSKEFLSSVLEDENFIGPIMGDGQAETYELTGELPVSIQMQSFDTYLKNKLDIDIDSNKTWNYCFLKKNNVSYPWGKLKGQPTILQTLQYLAENAVDGENNTAVNYLFWQDLNGYHFRSIESLIKESAESEQKTFAFNDNNLFANAIHSFETLSEFDGLDLLNSKTNFSWYERIIPDYADPYLDFVDTSDSMLRKVIFYDLKEDYNKIEHIESGKVFGEGFNGVTSENIQQNYNKFTESQRIDDDIYGFYSLNRYNTPHPQKWEYLGLSADSRFSNVVWQNQFDIDDEVYQENLYAYEKLIKSALVKNREKYVKLKNAKRKWEVYRCSVCCLNQIGGTADQQIIKGLNPSNPDYVYYFGPTGIFTEEQIGSSDSYQIIAGGAFSDVVNYDSGVTKNNGLTLSYDLNSEPFNKSIGEFYNLKLNSIDQNIQSIQNAINDYRKEITDTIDVALNELEPFVQNADDYAVAALDLIKTTLFPPRKVNCCNNSTDPAQCLTGPLGEQVDSCEDAECFGDSICFPASENQNGCTICTRGLIPGTDQELKSNIWENSTNRITGRTEYEFRVINDNDNRGNNTQDFSYGIDPYGQEAIDDFSIFDEIYDSPDLNSFIGVVPYWIKLLPDYELQEQLPSSNFGETGELVDVTFTYNNLSPIKILKEVFGRSFLRPFVDGFGILTETNADSEDSLTAQTNAAFFNEVLLDLREENYKDLPVVRPPFLYECSKHKIHDDYYYSPITGERIGYGNVFTLPDNIKETINNGDAFCLYCINPIYIQYKKYVAKDLVKKLKIKKIIIQKIIELLESNIQKYNNLYTEFYNRKAFFLSKNPFDSGLTGNINNKNSRLSLTNNIKSIKRKPIRGSKYEILANRIGITAGISGGKGFYEHKVYFNDDVSRNPGVTGSHPYYDQKYKKFVNKDNQIINYAVNYQLYSTNNSVVYIRDENQNKNVANLLFGGTSSLRPGQIVDPYIAIRRNTYFANQSSFLVPSFEQEFTTDLGSISIEKYNIFNQPLTDEDSDKLKPPSIQSEELASYVRVEFTEPIGLDRLADFPYGFIRDAGSEYFLPYLVQLTSGPSGRQTIQNNAVVIGIDPYGFDIAVKKNKTKNTYSDYKEWGNYWWKSSFNKDSLHRKTKDISDMSLWSELSFENEFTYFQNAGSYFYDIGHDFTESDNFSNYAKYKIGKYEDNYYCSEREELNSTNYEFSKNFSVIKKLPDLYTVNSSKYGGYNLLSSHTHYNTRRSWYDFNFGKNLYLDSNLIDTGSGDLINLNPLNIFFPKLFGLSQTPSNTNVNPPYQTDAVTREYLFTNRIESGKYQLITELASKIFSFRGNGTVNAYSYLPATRNPYAITLKDTEAIRTITSQFNDSSIDTSSGLIYNTESENNDQTLKLFVEDSFKKLNPNYESIFTEAVSHYLNADFVLYRPGLVTSDIWKYDIFGESEYGITKPPVLPPEYDNFDSNFAVQFVVFAKQTTTARKGICEQLNLPCLKPDKKETTSTGCPEDDPYCNCPGKSIMPKESEPSYKELAIAYENTKECKLITDVLGSDYLGCILSDHTNVSSCGCPEQGKFFPTFLNTIRSNATFYVTPPETPLRRQAQISLFNSQRAIMAIYPNDSLKIGEIINVDKSNPSTEYSNQKERISGKWMITGITRIFKSINVELMVLTLNRDSVYQENESTEASTYTRDIF